MFSLRQVDATFERRPTKVIHRVQLRKFGFGISWTSRHVRFVPCVDGSELARTFFTSAALVGAAMCSAC